MIYSGLKIGKNGVDKNGLVIQEDEYKADKDMEESITELSVLLSGVVQWKRYNGDGGNGIKMFFDYDNEDLTWICCKNGPDHIIVEDYSKFTKIMKEYYDREK